MRAAKAAPAETNEAAQVSARAQKAIQAHRAEMEAEKAHADKAPHADKAQHADKAPQADMTLHADKAQQARHSQASQAVDDAESGVVKSAKPAHHAVQGKASESSRVSHATTHAHQEVGHPVV